MSIHRPIKLTRAGAPWTLRELDDLGRLPDEMLAHRSQRALQEVVAMREIQRAAPPIHGRRWMPRELSLLGRVADADLAQLIHRSKQEVRRVRTRCHIQSANQSGKGSFSSEEEKKLLEVFNDHFVAARPKHQVIQWTLNQDKLLGTMSDVQVAATLGTTSFLVSQRRRQLGIPKAPLGPRRIPFTAAELKLFGTMSDQELGQRLKRRRWEIENQRRRMGIPRFNAKMRRWSPEEERFLGTAPDEQIAQQLKRSFQAVKARRRMAGLPPSETPRHSWSAETKASLDTKSHAQIAGMLNTPTLADRTRRQILPVSKP